MPKVAICPTTWYGNTRNHPSFDVDVDTFITKTLTREHQRSVIETCFSQSTNEKDFINRLKTEAMTGNILRIQDLDIEQGFSSADTYPHAFFIKGENLSQLAKYIVNLTCDKQTLVCSVEYRGSEICINVSRRSFQYLKDEPSWLKSKSEDYSRHFSNI